MTQPSQHIRLVILGGRSVGKSAIIKRFLFNTFMEKHRPTVEDLFYKEFNLGTMLLKCDFLDTSGGFEFPAMRRLNISNGNAFCLVYSIDDINSFMITKKCFEEIREIRNDFQEIPIIFAGNKADLPRESHIVTKEEVTEWVYCELPRLRTKVMECSAKTNWNIKELMKQFLSLAKINIPNADNSGLRRRSSAHASSNSKFRLNNLTPHIIPELIIDALTNPLGSDENPIQKHLNGTEFSPSNSPKHLSCSVNNQHSNSSLNLNSANTSNSSANTSADEGTNNGATLGQRLKPRSRSLIRRSSKKVNKIKDPNEPDDCYMQ